MNSYAPSSDNLPAHTKVGNLNIPELRDIYNNGLVRITTVGPVRRGPQATTRTPLVVLTLQKYREELFRNEASSLLKIWASIWGHFYLVTWDQPKGDYTNIDLDDIFEEQLEDVFDYLRQRTEKKTFNLVGLYLGGLAATHFAAKNRKSVSSLALIGTPLDYTHANKFLMPLQNKDLASKSQAAFGTISPELFRTQFLRSQELDEKAFFENWLLDGPLLAPRAMEDFSERIITGNSILEELKEAHLPVYFIAPRHDDLLHPDSCIPAKDNMPATKARARSWNGKASEVFTEYDVQQMIARLLAAWFGIRKRIKYNIYDAKARKEKSIDVKVQKMYRRYAHDIRLNLLKLSRNDEAASDLLQETFVRLHRSYQKGTKIQDVKAFLYRISYNLYLSHRRKNLRWEYETLSEVGPLPSPTRFTDQIHWQMLRQKIVDRLEKESPDLSRIFILRIEYNMTYEQISESLGISNRTARRYADKIKALIIQNFSDQLPMSANL